MGPSSYFTAPWSGQVKIITFLASAFMLGIPILQHIPGSGFHSGRQFLWLLPLLVVIVSLFMVRGYELAQDALYVQRLFWKTKIDLSSLNSVAIDPEATSGSIRTAGNGGFFAFTGMFRNKKLGSYRAYITDRKKAVVLRFVNRVIVISPGDPQDFERQIKQYRGLS